MILSLNRFLLASALVLFLFGCAQVIPPQGGARDTQPPQVVEMTPKNRSLNFEASSFYIEFDEFVQLNDVYNQLLISPPLEDRPQISIKRKGVLVEFDEELKPNTTYTFNFGEGVTDFTEGNPAEDLVFVFSTGDVLDSLGMQGIVTSAFTTEPQEGVKVMLYEGRDDSLPMKQKPYYFGITDEQGRYDVGYMKPGDYKVFALQEELSNYLYDSPEERIGFLDSLVSASVVDSSMKQVELRTFLEDSELQFIKEWTTDSVGFISIQLNRKPLNPEVEVLTIGADTSYAMEQLEGDSIYVWLTGQPTDEKIDLEISDNGEVLDTIRVTFENREIIPTTRNSLTPKLTAKATQPSEDDIFLATRTLVAAVDTSKIELLRDSIPMEFSIDEVDDSFSKVQLIADFEDDNQYKLELLPGAIVDYRGYQNDTTDFSFGTFSAKHFGNFSMTISGLQIDQGQGVLQLLKDDEVVEERMISGDGVFEYNRVLPGTYRMRIIFDENQNGKWDTGNYLEKKQPEYVVYLPKDIGVRSNWEIEMEWQLDDQNSDK
ncbi:Ig-like domain-containing domain [Halocola ammonii]